MLKDTKKYLKTEQFISNDTLCKLLDECTKLPKTKKGNKYEEVIALCFQSTEYHKVVKLPGKDVMVTVLEKSPLFNIAKYLIVECKNKIEPVKTNDIRSLKEKIERFIGFNFSVLGVLVMTSDFQDGAKNILSRTFIVHIKHKELIKWLRSGKTICTLVEQKFLKMS